MDSQLSDLSQSIFDFRLIERWKIFFDLGESVYYLISISSCNFHQTINKHSVDFLVIDIYLTNQMM